jgi:hypothetical protein
MPEVATTRKFSAFVQAVIAGEADVASDLLHAHPELATEAFALGATRSSASPVF